MIKNYLLLTLMIVLWSFSFIVVDISVEIIPPISVAFYRFFITSLSFLIIDIYLKLIKKSTRNNNSIPDTNAKFTKNDWILIEMAAFTGVIIFFYVQYNAISLIGPSLPALFVCLLSPVVITILALLFFDEKVNTLKIVGFIVATVGGFLLVTGGDLRNLTPESPNFLGYFFAVLTSVLWAVYSTITKKITETNSSMKMVKFLCYVSTPQLFILVLINGELIILIENLFNIVIVLAELYLGIACTLIGYYIWQNSQKEMKSSKVASFLYVEPFLTLLFSFLLQRTETIVLWNIIGGIIVLIAVLIINYEKKTEDIN